MSDAPPGSAYERRLLRALLRWRMRRILAGLSFRDRLALRVLPSLLHASFPAQDLRGEAPGIEGVSSGRSWLTAGRAFGLPPPSSTQRHRRTIRAVVALPSEQGLALSILPIPGIRPQELEQIAQRCKVAQSLVERQGAKISIRIGELLEEQPSGSLPIVLFGGLVAGDLPHQPWETLRVEDAASLAALVDAAPSRLAAASLMLLHPGSRTSAWSTFLQAHQQGLSVALLSDPELFCAAWVSRRRPRGMLPLEALRVAGSAASSRRAAASWLGGDETGRPAGTDRSSSGAGQPPPAHPSAMPAVPSSSGFAGQPPSAGTVAGWGGRSAADTLHKTAEVREARAIAELGRALTVEVSRAIRRHHPLAASAELRRQFRRDFLTRSGLPTLLRSTLDARLEGIGPLRLADLIALGGGGITSSHLETELIRGLALLGPAAFRAAAKLDPPWPRIALRLETPVDRPTILLSIGVQAIDGPPMDPLNRGRARENSLRNPLFVCLSPHRRPTAHRQLPDHAVARLLAEASRDRDLEFIAEEPTAEPAASRLQRLAVRVGAATRRGMPLATEVGGQVMMPTADGLRDYALRRFAARPRLYTPDPEAPDLGAVGGHIGAAPRGTLDCLVLEEGPAHAVLITTDASGHRLREEVPAHRLVTHLEEARAHLRRAPEPLVLTVRKVGAERPPLHLPPEADPIALAADGELLHGVQLTLLGERYGSGSPLGWEAAAASLLSVWPATSYPSLAIRRLDLRHRGQPLSGLVLLYARSVVLRRLDLHMRRMSYT